MSHEIRTPLSAMLANIELLSKIEAGKLDLVNDTFSISSMRRQVETHPVD
jgi:signal transduction histidine kinase